MSHLGERLSALIDGELDGAELDRAHAHLAGCEPCRTAAPSAPGRARPPPGGGLGDLSPGIGPAP